MLRRHAAGILAVLWLVAGAMVYSGAKIPRPAALAIAVVALACTVRALAADLAERAKAGRLGLARISSALLILWLAGVVSGVAVLDELVIRRFCQISYHAGKWAQGRTSWLGIPSLQHPCDNWVFQEIVWEVKPDFIIETGTYRGGTSLFLAGLLEAANPEGKVITIDINPEVDQVSVHTAFQKRVEVIRSDSVDPTMVAGLRERVRGKKVVVTLDSLHTKEHVLRELRLYAPLVSPGSYLVVQDTVVNGHPVWPTFGPGPMEAIREFLRESPDFASDRSKEKLLITYYPRGYLRRVR